MRAIGWLACRIGALALLGAVAAPRNAAADTMDPALARLVTDTNCQASGKNGGVYYNPTSGGVPCGLDNAAFAKLIAQYGAAIAPTAMHSARTTGYGGFELSFEADFTSIDSTASYWKKGTQGPQDPTSKNFSTENVDPPGMLQLYNLKIRKGFPFGLELAADFGYLAQTSIFTLGANVRMSIFEGFRTGVPAFFPELAVGGTVRTITGTDQFQLTVVGVDGDLSKPIPIAGAVVLTPWLGYQYLRIFGDSGLINLTPNTDPIDYCGFTGTDIPTPSSNQGHSGQPVCKSGASGTNNTSLAFNDIAVFQAVRLNRHRIVAGLNLRVQMFTIGGQFMYDLVDPASANSGSTCDTLQGGCAGISQKSWASTNIYAASPTSPAVTKQMTLAFDIGAIF
jgi:hypothetical protein